jgi:hypothetical protein
MRRNRPPRSKRLDVFQRVCQCSFRDEFIEFIDGELL